MNTYFVVMLCNQDADLKGLSSVKRQLPFVFFLSPVLMLLGIADNKATIKSRIEMESNVFISTLEIYSKPVKSLKKWSYLWENI